MNKLLVRLGVAGVAVAGTVWVVRKYRANKDQAEELLQQGVAKATELVDRAHTLLDVAATQFATSWLGQQNEEQEVEAEKPADQYTNSNPLLDDGGKS